MPMPIRSSKRFALLRPSRPLLLFLITARLLTTQAQQIDWCLYDTVTYSFNPTYGTTPAGSGLQQQLNCAWLGSFALSYNQKIYGTQVIRAIQPSGATVSTHFLGPKVEVRSLLTRSNGDLIISGSFMDTLFADGTPQFSVNSNQLYARNVFLLCYSATGTLRWSRNVSTSYSGLENLDADAIDRNGNYWFASMAWSQQLSIAVGIGDAGQDSVLRPLPAVQALLSDMAFDASGAMYLSGGIGTGAFLFGGLPVSISASYNKFLAKMDVQGQGRWFSTIPDITFQPHQISVTDSAEIYFTGDLSDSVTVGGYFLNGPDWVFDLLTVKFDSSGSVLWAQDVPEGPTITGDLQLATGHSIAADDSGYYQLVRFRGIVDLGNGRQIGFASPTVSYGMSLIRYDQAGVPQWNLDVPSVYGIYPSTVLSDPYGGYITGTASGSQQIGPANIAMPSPFTYFSWSARFTGSGLSFISDDQDRVRLTLYPNPSCDGRLRIAGIREGEELIIHDLMGRLCCKFSVRSNDELFETGLPSGSYLISVSGVLPMRWTVVR